MAVVIAIVGGLVVRATKTSHDNNTNTVAEQKNDYDEELNDNQRNDYEEEDVYEAESQDEAVPDNVNRILEKYQEQVDGYYHNDNLESSPVEYGYVYYLYDELIEVNYVVAEGWGTDYYYDNGSVYYAISNNDAGETDQLFYENESLIYWIDSYGNHHSAAEAEENWGDTIYEAEELYYLYGDKSVVFKETSEYILPNSDCEYMSKSDLYGLSEWEVRLARNEIMARHGRRFKDQSLQEYFDSCSWYSGTMSPDEFDRNYESNLNEYEKKNATTIKEYAKEQGYNQ